MNRVSEISISDIEVEDQQLVKIGGDFLAKQTCETCPWILKDGQLCPCSLCPCLGGAKGCFGYKECCGHKVAGFEPKWLFKLILIMTELTWAVKLQKATNEFDVQVVRPMAWVAWTGMMMHVTLQFCNRMCLGKIPIVNDLSLWIDLIYDDAVQLTALGLHWGYGAGFGKGVDHGAAVISGILAFFFAVHNLFNLLTSGKKSCWGKGFTTDDYNPKDHLEDAWCPYCICPGVSKCMTWLCRCSCMSCCFQTLENGKKECNLMCLTLPVKADGEASTVGICCQLFFNTWIMTILGIHVASTGMWLANFGTPETNKYADKCITLAWVAVGVGGTSLLGAYIIEFIRGKWIAVHGVLGSKTGLKTPQDFYRLNHFMAAFLTINLGGSLIPWVVVLSEMMKVDGVSTIAVAGSIQVIFAMFLSFWEIVTREAGICEEYRKRHQEDLLTNARKNIVNKYKPTMETLKEQNEDDLESNATSRNMLSQINEVDDEYDSESGDVEQGNRQNNWVNSDDEQ